MRDAVAASLDAAVTECVQGPLVVDVWMVCVTGSSLVLGCGRGSVASSPGAATNHSLPASDMSALAAYTADTFTAWHSTARHTTG